MTKKQIVACLENDLDVASDTGDARELVENLYASLSVLLKNAKETP